MKKILQILFLIAFALPSLAANWHPFPFKAAFYGRPVALGSYQGLNPAFSSGPLVKGFVVEGLYMDSAFQKSNGIQCRIRSSEYFLGLGGGDKELGPNFDLTEVRTSIDSNRVVYLNHSPFSNALDSLVYYPKNQSIGSAAPVQKAIATIFNFQDSVSTIQLNGNSYVWSKTFGIIEMPLYIQGEIVSLKLIGIHDLNLGWKPFTGKPAIPKAGDEYHYRQIKKLEVLQGGQFCIPKYVNEAVDLRIKVLAYPYQNDSTRAQYEHIVSNAGESTGVLFDNVSDIYTFMLIGSSKEFSSGYRFPGTYFPSGPIYFSQSSFGYLVDSLGITLAYRISPIVLDGDFQYSFIPCSPNPFSKYEKWWSSGGPFTCNSNSLEFSYPLYLNVQNGCTMGSPLPPITITSVSKSTAKNKVQLLPNPAKSMVTIRIPDQSESQPQYDLIDTKGQIQSGLLQCQNSEAQLDLRRYAAGLYTLRITAGNGVWMERLVLEE